MISKRRRSVSDALSRDNTTPKSNCATTVTQINQNHSELYTLDISVSTWHVRALWPGLPHLLHRRIVAGLASSPPLFSRISFAACSWASF